jgi:D-glycero-D-manno-heptose 1,7-bisphosphate phosphatase
VSGRPAVSARAPIALGPSGLATSAISPVGAPTSARAPTPAGRPAVFLDRDGVINAGAPDLDSGLLESPLRIADVRLLPGVPAALRALARAGHALVCVTNQPAAAKGKASVAELLAVHRRVLELLARDGTRLDASRLCPHHPDGIVPELSGPCACRKPAPGMLLDAAAELALDLRASWMIGDTDADVRAGHRVGCKTVLIEYPGSAHKRAGRIAPDILARDLTGAVNSLARWSSLTNSSRGRDESA